jgi:hypothetical protein
MEKAPIEKLQMGKNLKEFGKMVKELSGLTTTLIKTDFNRESELSLKLIIKSLN